MPPGDRGSSRAQPREPQPASLKRLGCAAQRAFGRLEKAMRAAHQPPITQIGFTDALRQVGADRYGVHKIWDTREIRRLDNGGMALRPDFVWTVIAALRADLLDAGLLLEVAGMNGVSWAVLEIQQHPDHPLLREALSQRLAEPEVAQAVLQSLPPAPRSASPAPIVRSVDLLAADVTLEAARQIFRGMLLTVLTDHVDGVLRAAGLAVGPAAHPAPDAPVPPDTATPSQLPSKTRPILGR